MLCSVFRRLESQRSEIIDKFAEFRCEVRKAVLKQTSDEARCKELLDLCKTYDAYLAKAKSH